MYDYNVQMVMTVNDSHNIKNKNFAVRSVTLSLFLLSEKFHFN